jgi:hypothetical protein
MNENPICSSLPRRKVCCLHYRLLNITASSRGNFRTGNQLILDAELGISILQKEFGKKVSLSRLIHKFHGMLAGNLGIEIGPVACNEPVIGVLRKISSRSFVGKQQEDALSWLIFVYFSRCSSARRQKDFQWNRRELVYPKASRISSSITFYS